MAAPTRTAHSGHRFAILDVVRGFFILLMMVGHTITFTYNGLNSFVWAISGVADFICFTGLLLLSGMSGYISYIHEKHSSYSVYNRILKRLNIYVIGYWLVALLGLARSQTITLENIWQIISFQKLVPYTEFIPAFILFALFKLFFRSLVRKLTHQLYFLATFSVFTYGLGLLLHYANLGFTPTWHALIFGSPGYYSFPVFFYAPVYFIGLLLGYRLYSRGSRLLRKPLVIVSSIALAIVLGSTVYSVIFNNLASYLSRWPPSLPFLFLSVLGVVGLLFFTSQTSILNRFPGIRALLILCGQNAFALFFTHTSLLFLFDLLNFNAATNSITITIFSIGSIVLAIYLAKILPLNYSFGLTIYTAFEDGHLTKSEEHRLSKAFSRFLYQISSLGSLFSIPIRGRSVRLLNFKSLGVASLILVLASSPLGTAEESALLTQIVSNNPPRLTRTWFLTTDTSIDLKVSLTPELEEKNTQLIAIIDNHVQYPLTAHNNQATVSIPISGLNIGQHFLQYEYKVNQISQKTTAQEFFISHPLYVSWTIDWEGYSTPNAYLVALENFSSQYSIPMTHLFNPRIYFTQEIDAQRVEYEAQWVRNRLYHGDDFGMHLHMHPDLIASASVTPKTEPTWGGGFSPGYDVLTTAYTYDEMVQILNFSKAVLSQNGFPDPKFFRAGAWYADITTLKALQDTGFLADTSGRTAYTFGTNNLPGYWSLDATTQPYYPSLSNQNSPYPLPRLSILEIPNNGADSYWFTEADMIKRTQENFNGFPLNKPLQVTFLTHPHWFDPKEQNRIKVLFDYLTTIHHQHGHGPAIFVGLSQIYEAFK